TIDRTVCLPEPVEDVWQKFRIDSEARIADDEECFVLQFFQPDFDESIWISEFDGVREQIPDNLFDALGISVERADPGFQPELQSQSLRFDCRAPRVHGRFD